MQPMTVTCVQSLQYPGPNGPFCHWLLNKTVPSREPPRQVPTPGKLYTSLSAPQKQRQPAATKPRWPQSQEPPASTAGWQNSYTSASLLQHWNELYLSLLNFCEITHVLLAEDQLHRHRHPKVLLPDGEQQFQEAIGGIVLYTQPLRALLWGFDPKTQRNTIWN